MATRVRRSILNSWFTHWLFTWTHEETDWGQVKSREDSWHVTARAWRHRVCFTYRFKYMWAKHHLIKMVFKICFNLGSGLMVLQISTIHCLSNRSVRSEIVTVPTQMFIGPGTQQYGIVLWMGVPLPVWLSGWYLMCPCSVLWPLFWCAWNTWLTKKQCQLKSAHKIRSHSSLRRELLLVFI